MHASVTDHARVFVNENNCSNVFHDAYCVSACDSERDTSATVDNAMHLSSDVNNAVNTKATSFCTFLTWNINGLMSKLLDNDFVSYVCSFDFICLTETFVEDFSSTFFFWF